MISFELIRSLYELLAQTFSFCELTELEVAPHQIAIVENVAPIQQVLFNEVDLTQN